MRFSDKLKELRAKKKVTQVEVAKAVGLPRRTYISYEREGRYPRDKKVYKDLADYFKVDLDYLIGGDEKFILDASEKYGNRGKRQAEELVAELSGLFAGGELSEEDMGEVVIALQQAYWDCKKDNKKYTPKKYLSDEEGA